MEEPGTVISSILHLGLILYFFVTFTLLIFGINLFFCLIYFG